MFLPQTVAVREKESLADLFTINYSYQEHWHLWHALWFWAMGFGAALFLVRQLHGLNEVATIWGMSLPDVLGVVLVAIGGLILIADLGQPLRVLNALRQPGRSWIARGAIADFAFLGLGILYVLAGPFNLPWSDAVFSEAGLGTQIMILIMAFMALLIIVYPGFVLYESLGVPFWVNALVPVLFFSYAFQSAYALMFALIPGDSTLYWGFLITLLDSIFLTWLYLYVMGRHNPKAAVKGAQRMVKGRWSAFFWLTMLIGEIVPLILLVFFSSWTGGYWLMAILAILGSLGLRYVQLLSGLRQSAIG